MNREFIRFIIVGCINTLVGTSIMFIAYNFAHLSYWTSTILNYTLASILSYFLNKHFTFKNTANNSSFILFIFNIVICYLLAYIPIKFLITQLFIGEYSISVVENTSMLLGMVIFTILNFMGQKLIIFKK